MATIPTLSGLPTELINMIAEYLYEPPNPSKFNRYTTHIDLSPLSPLFSLALANRRLSEIITPILYRAGVKDFAHLPLAWAAKKGVAGALKKALDAGADPNHKFVYTTKESVWMEAQVFLDSAVRWEARDPDYWPTSQRGKASIALTTREASPTFDHLDVYAPVIRSVSIAMGAAAAVARRAATSNPLPRPSASDTNGVNGNASINHADAGAGSDGMGAMGEVGDEDEDTQEDTDMDDDDMDEDYGFGPWGGFEQDMDDEIDEDYMDEDDGFMPWGGFEDEEEEPDLLLTRKHTAIHIAAKEGHDDIVTMLVGCRIAQNSCG